MLQEWLRQRPMRDAGKMRQRLIDRQMVIDEAIDRWYRLTARGYFEHLTTSNVFFLSHCIVGPYVFILCLRDVTDVD